MSVIALAAICCLLAGAAAPASAAAPAPLRGAPALRAACPSPLVAKVCAGEKLCEKREGDGEVLRIFARKLACSRAKKLFYDIGHGGAPSPWVCHSLGTGGYCYRSAVGKPLDWAQIRKRRHLRFSVN